LWFSDRKSFGKWEIKRHARGGEATLAELIDCAVNVRKSFAFLRSTLWAFIRSDLFRSVFLVLCSCLPFHSFLTSRVAPSFPACSNNQREINNSKASPSRNFAGKGKAFAAMDWASLGGQTDLSFVDENASDSILRNNEPNSIQTDESDLQ
jgi:hypothetical protein